VSLFFVRENRRRAAGGKMMNTHQLLPPLGRRVGRVKDRDLPVLRRQVRHQVAQRRVQRAISSFDTFAV
jgi:hypothetical protein